MNTDRVGITLSVIVYPEDGEFVALALEMDLRGYGSTSEEAMEELRELIAVQLSSALQTHGSIESAMFRAEAQYFDMYHHAKLDEMKALFGERRQSSRTSAVFSDIPIPDPHVIAQMKGGHTLGHG